MPAFPLKWLGFTIAVSVQLAACGGAPPDQGQNASAEDFTGPATTAATPEQIAAAKAGAEIVYCPRNKQHVTRIECKRLNEIWDNLETGKAAIEAPDEMVREEASTVSFAIAGESSGQTVEDVLGTEGFNGAVDEVKIGGVMAARLTGRGFRIEPAETVRKELGPAGSMLWEWQVTPLKDHGDRLRVQAFVIVPGPNGSRQESPLKTFSKDVKVKVTGGQRLGDWMDESSAWFQRGNNWLKALAGLLTALGAVLVALRALRSRPKPAPPG
jgi:hypothetical protein